MLVDCAPSLGILTANALIGVKEVLIPVETHHLALPGVDRVMASVETVRKHLNAGLKVTGILACRVDPRTRHSKNILKQLRERYGSLVYKSEIRENIRLAEAPALSMPITVFDPESTGTQDYDNLAGEIIAAEKVRKKK
jgi:chromosome partitioning protein